MASGLYSQHVNNKKMLYLRNTIIILMLVTLAVCCLFPLFYMIVNSFGPAVEAASSNRSVFPTSWSLDSYKAFFSVSTASNGWPTPLWCPPARCWAMLCSPVWPVMPLPS